MDNYRRPMYNRGNRGMGNYNNQPCGCTPVMEAGKEDRCEKDMFASCVDKLPLAMAYVPFQKWRKVYDASAGLARGTIFEELDLPFYGDRNMCGMRGDR